MPSNARRFIAVLMLLSSPAFADPAVTILALGDSTTAGTPGFESPAEKPPQGEGDEQSQYAYWMMRKHPEWKVINAGIRGQRSGEIRDRFDGLVQEHHPRYIIILAGVNDIVNDIPLDHVTRNLLWMYQEAKKQNIVPVAVTILPINRATARQNEAIRMVNDWIKKSSDRLRIPYVDLHAAVADPEDPQKLNGSPDDIHPDVGGYRKMGAELTKTIEHFEKYRPGR